MRSLPRPTLRLALTSALVVSACASPDERAGASGGVLFDESFDGRASDVVLSLHTANVDVRTTRANGARVRVEARGADAAEAFERARFSATLDGDRLVVATEPERSASWMRGGFEVIVEVPETVSVDAEVESGDVSVEALKGSVAIETGSGNVRVAAVSEAAEVETGSGDVRVGPVAGGVDVGTGSGNVEAEVSSGAPVAVETGSGDVSLTVPADAGFDVTVNTGSGDIRIGSALDYSGRAQDRSRAGRFGAGGAPLRVGTGSGDIEIDAR